MDTKQLAILGIGVGGVAKAYMDLSWKQAAILAAAAVVFAAVSDNVAGNN